MHFSLEIILNRLHQFKNIVRIETVAVAAACSEI